MWVFREVLWAFAVRQVKVKYKQAAIGVGWAVLQPVAAAALFAVFLGRVAHVSSEGVPYILFALSGTVVWMYFSGSASSASESLVTDSALLRKVFFPREVLPLAAILAGVVDFVPGFLTLVVASLLRDRPGRHLGRPPARTRDRGAAGGRVRTGLSGVNVYYRDVRYVLPFVPQLGLFATVVYRSTASPAGWRGLYEILNPLAAAIEGSGGSSSR